MKTIDKLSYIHDDLYPFCWNTFFSSDFSSDNGWTVLYIFVGPLLTTVLYLYAIYPFLGKKVYKDHKEHIKSYEEIKVDIEGRTSMSDEDAIILKSKLRTIRTAHSKELDEKDSEIAVLIKSLDKVSEEFETVRRKLSTNEEIESQLEKLRKNNKQLENDLSENKSNLKGALVENSMLKKQIELEGISGEHNKELKTGNNLSDSGIRVIKKLSDNPEWVTENDIRKITKEHRLRNIETINSLLTAKYITKGNRNGIHVYKITASAEQLLIDNGLV